MPKHSLEWRERLKTPRFAWESTDDPKYIKDRDEFFAEHGNGWWWTEALGSNKYKSQMMKRRKSYL